MVTRTETVAAIAATALVAPVPSPPRLFQLWLPRSGSNRSSTAYFTNSTRPERNLGPPMTRRKLCW